MSARHRSSSKRLTYASALVLMLWIVVVTILIWLTPPESAPEQAKLNTRIAGGAMQTICDPRSGQDRAWMTPPPEGDPPARCFARATNYSSTYRTAIDMLP